MSESHRDASRVLGGEEAVVGEEEGLETAAVLSLVFQGSQI